MIEHHICNTINISSLSYSKNSSLHETEIWNTNFFATIIHKTHSNICFFFSSSDRMERRERDKQERAKMSLIQNNEPEPEMPCLFSALPFRVRMIIFLKYLLELSFKCYIKENKSDRERSSNSIEFGRFSMFETTDWTW